MYCSRLGDMLMLTVVPHCTVLCSVWIKWLFYQKSVNMLGVSQRVCEPSRAVSHLSYLWRCSVWDNIAVFGRELAEKDCCVVVSLRAGEPKLNAIAEITLYYLFCRWLWCSVNGIKSNQTKQRSVNASMKHSRQGHWTTSVGAKLAWSIPTQAAE